MRSLCLDVHPRYSEAVVRIVQQRESRLVVTYGAMDKVPSEELTTACRDVEQQARALFDRWVAEFGEKLR